MFTIILGTMVNTNEIDYFNANDKRVVMHLKSGSIITSSKFNNYGEVWAEITKLQDELNSQAQAAKNKTDSGAKLDTVVSVVNAIAQAYK